MTRITLILAAALLAHGMFQPEARARELTEAEIRGWVEHISKIQRRRRQARGDPDLLVQLAEAYGRVGDIARAVRAVRRAERAGAPRLATRTVEADTYRRWGHNARAIPLYLEIVDDAPAQTHALVQLWRIAVEEVVAGREATPLLQEVRGRLRGMGMFVPDVFAPGPDAAAEATRLAAEGRDLLAAGQPDQAIVRAEQSISQDPGFARAFELLFRANAHLGEADRALGAATIYLEIDPDGDAAGDARELVLAYYRRMVLGTVGP